MKVKIGFNFFVTISPDGKVFNDSLDEMNLDPHALVFLEAGKNRLIKHSLNENRQLVASGLMSFFPKIHLKLIAVFASLY